MLVEVSSGHPAKYDEPKAKRRTACGHDEMPSDDYLVTASRRSGLGSGASAAKKRSLKTYYRNPRRAAGFRAR